MIALNDPYLKNFSLAATVDVSKELYPEIAEVLNKFGSSRRPAVVRVSGGTEDDGPTYSVGLLVGSHEVDNETYHVLVEVSARRRSQPPPPSERSRLASNAAIISDILGEIGQFSLHCNAQCTVTWEIPLEKTQSLIPLPLLQIDAPGVPFQQISGIRLTGGDNEYGVYVNLSLVNSNMMEVVAHFVISDLLVPEIIEQAVKEGTSRMAAVVTILDV